MRKFSKIITGCLLCLCLTGSLGPASGPRFPVVTRVDVECRQGPVRQRRHYTDPVKMEWILNYLRMHRSLGPAQTDPDRLEGDSYTIFLELTDGSRLVYFQQADRYLSKDFHPWQKVDPAWGRSLYYLLQTLPSDPPVRRFFPGNFGFSMVKGTDL